MRDILCIGLMVCDLIIKPVTKKAMDVDSSALDVFEIASGGDALNVSINLAKQGVKTTLVGKVGQDNFADFLMDKAKKAGVDTEHIVQTEAFTTSTSVVMIEDNGERHFLYYGKCNHDLGVEDIDERLIEDAKIVHVGSAMALRKLDGYGLVELFKKAKAKGKITTMDVTCDAEGVWLPKIEEALYYTDIFMPSYEEATKISKKTELSDIRDFFKGYDIKTLVVKLGSEGCYVTDFVNEYHIPIIEGLNVVDSTGAGDAFVSGFLNGTLQGLSIEDRAKLGTEVAAKCISKIGATTWTES